MANYYLDIETTGLDPQKDKVITIQFQELDRSSGEPIGKLVILKEWESNEKKILEQFIDECHLKDPYPFTFVPIGNNFNFKHNFLLEKTKHYGLPPIDILSRPFIDLRSFTIIMNKGEFKGSGLDKITGKNLDGNKVPHWYYHQEFDTIEIYIKDKTHEFVKLTTWLYREMPKFLERFQIENRVR
ncbi:MAG: ribonuclease H-like domain-containing protein [Candidatus Diapherotrites archaeon]|uniref:Ribonuclease H-like domain-containing protein n=1 Tax=Candidatus Iainarchaeum sp. TaxID=3101447 RepID=A0A8T4L4W8_9ARCH|nr:ribonuclease H-like domain-containing protein [Candidatus Diapherotrites archaeon]